MEWWCPVWAKFCHTRLVYTCLISGCLRPNQIPWLPVLANIVPKDTRCKTATDNMICKISAQPDWTVHTDVFEHLPHGLHLSLDIQFGLQWHPSTYPSSGERIACRLLWSTTCLLQTVLCDNQDSVYLTVHGHCLINHFRTGQRCCLANINKWRLATTNIGTCSQWQTMNHLVDLCPLTKLEGSLPPLHNAGNDAVHRLEHVATTVFAKWKWMLWDC